MDFGSSCLYLLGLCSVGYQTQASCMLGKYSTTELHPQPFLFFVCLLTQHLTVQPKLALSSLCGPGWPPTSDSPLASVLQVLVF